MKRIALQKMVLSGVFAALIFVMTAFLSFPLPGGGYANLGDCFVLTTGLMIGPIYGGLAAAVFALAAGKATAKFGLVRLGLSAVLSEIIMVLGYFLFESFLYGLIGAAANTVGNSVQGLIGAIAAVVLSGVLFKTVITNKIRK